jgi:glucokinase
VNHRIAALDIGSSTIRYALGTAGGELVTDPRTEPTRADQLESQVLEILDGLQSRDSGFDAVSVSTTGLVDVEECRIDRFDTVDGHEIRDIDLGARVRERFGVKCYLGNDCNVAALGEHEFGAGRDYDCLVHVTIATGIGAGVVVHDTLLRGENGHAVEVGHFPVGGPEGVTSGEVTDSWEAYCSGRGIPQFVAAMLREKSRPSTLRNRDPLTAADLFQAAEAGDAVAMDCLAQINRFNAAGVGGIVDAFNPGIITFGGGVALNHPDVLLDGIERHLDEYTYCEQPTLQITPLGENIELYGALARPAFGAFPQAAPPPESGMPAPSRQD